MDQVLPVRDGSHAVVSRGAPNWGGAACELFDGLEF